ncbi:MAG: error-prone DNA polymerase [Polyangiaceae bacterium]
MAFAELAARSCFSFLRGASHPEELVERGAELSLSALTLADHMGLYGVVRAHARAEELGVPLIIGAELSLATPGTSPNAAEATSGSLIVLARDHLGYTNLCRLLTRCHADVPKGQGRLEPAWLGEHAEGLTLLLPGPASAAPGERAADDVIASACDAFGDRAFVVAYRHLDGYDAERLRIVEGWSRRYGLTVVASARPRFHDRSRKPLADVLHCIREGTTLDQAGTALSANAEAFLRSEAEMLRLFRDRPAWVGLSAELAAEHHFSLKELRYQFPCQLEPGESADDKLRRLSWQGAARRYPAGVPETVRAQIERELGLIELLQVAPYFLSTWEIVEIARDKRILCQGRGSAANSAVCFVLGITAVDPARSSLLFERFMSPERREPPDIDIDFEHERREEVIQEIYARHGRDRAAMVSEVICYRGKSALREVGKVFGLSLEQIDRLSGTITHWDTAETSDARLAEVGFDPRDARLGQVVRIAQALAGFPRHLSIHVGGFVLSAAPLSAVAPVEPARMEDRTVLPWDKDDIEVLGFFKVDVLGLGMLTAVRKCLELIHEGGGLRLAAINTEGELAASNAESAASGDELARAACADVFDPLEVVTRIPPEDPAVYDLTCRGDTVGVFQIESRAQMAMLPRLRPRRFYDLVIEVAIVRPGPIQGGMVHPYLRRRNGEEAVRSPHPDLWPILERTLGVPLFQEQVMQIAIEGAGYSGGEADQLRRDMAAWKKNGRLLRHKDRLLHGFAKKGISRSFGEALFEQIKGFGDYGFPESHAASFALIVYSSAWQKAHYPAHFVCALINSQPMGFYSKSTLLSDAQRHGVEVRDVCIQTSGWDCTLEPAGPGCRIESDAPGARRAVRLGLRVIKGLSEAKARVIEAERAKGAFSDLGDLMRRTGLRRDELDKLAKAGALEALSAGRRQALWQLRAPRVAGLFHGIEPEEQRVELPPLVRAEQLVLDYGEKGLSVDDHPMRHLRARLHRRGVLSATELSAVPQGRRVETAGLVICRQQPGTASGVVFITLEDETGFANLVLWNRVYQQLRLVARHATLLLARGRIEREPNPDARESTKAQSARALAKGQGRRGVRTTSGAPDAPTPVIHLIVEHLERLDVHRGRHWRMSRDFH